MDRVPLADVEREAEETNKPLLATDKRFRHSVRVIEDEGTTHHFMNAFYERLYEGQWVVIYSEHHRPYILSADDVYSIQEFTEVKKR
jgi:hypothetical protein